MVIQDSSRTLSLKGGGAIVHTTGCWDWVWEEMCPSCVKPKKLGISDLTEFNIFNSYFIHAYLQF